MTFNSNSALECNVCKGLKVVFFQDTTGSCYWINLQYCVEHRRSPRGNNSSHSSMEESGSGAINPDWVRLGDKRDVGTSDI